MNPVNTTPYQLPNDATWFITGCSTGIGRGLAENVASKPEQRLIATARNVDSLSYLPDNKNILKVALDVTSPDSVDKAFKHAAARFGSGFHIDVLVNNAGYSLSGDTENVTEAEMKDEMETNFFGSVRCSIKAVANMRKHPEKRGGIIYQISSLGGVCAFPGQSFYHASKYAIEGWTESFAREMHPDWNINFCLVEPSAVKTNFESTSKKHIKIHEAYDGEDMPARKLHQFVKQGIKAGAGMEVDKVVDTLNFIATRNQNVPLHLVLSPQAIQLIKMGIQGRMADVDASAELQGGTSEVQFKLN